MFIVTVPTTANLLLRGQLAYLRERGFDITVISSPGEELQEVASREGVRVVAVPMSREIAPAADVRSLALLAKELRALRPDIVNASTPKAGLLGMMAAASLSVPHRVYLLRGLRLETERGLKRNVLIATERIAAACAHRVWCNSESLRRTLTSLGLAHAQKCVVIGDGSSNGVDVQRFARTSSRLAQAQKLRLDLGIAEDAPVIGFIGRPVVDKGIAELLAAFDRVRNARPAVRLLVVGAGLAGDPATDELAARRDVVLVPRVVDPAPYYAMMDVFAFPSHREGFPNAPLEAAAAGVPTVGFSVTGVLDAVVNGQTGRLVQYGDSVALGDALIGYLDDEPLRLADGERARVRAVNEFARERVWEHMSQAYAGLVRENSGI